MERIILGEPGEGTQKIEDFRKASVEKQRFLVYTNKVPDLRQVIKYETDEKLCYFFEELRARMGTVGFVQRKAKEGFTFDKKKKKLSIWFGKSIMKLASFLMEEMMKDLKMEWFNNMSFELKSLCNRALLERVIKGRITNPRDFVKAYLKTSLRIKGLSPELYYQLFKGDVKLPSSSYRVLSPGKLNELLRHSKSPEWVLKNITTAPIFTNNLMDDIINECKILGKKFDWSWSLTRIKEEHTLMTRQIQGYELEFVSDKSISYIDEPQLPTGWEFITSEKRLFLEGSNQSHCVYSYWNNVERKEQFILTIKQANGSEVTASIGKHGWIESTKIFGDKGWRVSQIYGYKNDNGPEDTKCTQETKDKVRDWAMSPELQEFFENQQPKRVVTTIDAPYAEQELPF